MRISTLVKFPHDSLGNSLSLCFTYIALCFVFHTTVRSPWYVMLVQNVLSKQAGSWNLISVSSYCAVCLVKQVKFCKCNLEILLHAKDKKWLTATSSGQDEANPAFLLATQAGEIGPFCPLGISHVGPASKSSLLGHVIDHLLTMRRAQLFEGWLALTRG